MKKPQRKINIVFVFALLIIALIGTLLGSCTPYSCPTYSDTDIKSDTARFTNAEKTGAVLFVLFAVYAINNAEE